MRTFPVATPWRGLSIAVCAAFCVYCTPPAPDDGSAAAGVAADPQLPAPADARYMTHLLFASQDGTGFLGSFDQTAEQDRLMRTYDVWWTVGGGWRPLVRHRDTLPVARAAWRLLPVAGMSVRIGDAGQVVDLSFAPPADASRDTVRLRAGEEVSVWTGPTGQRESLGLGVLQTGGEGAAGILFFRRAARALRIAPTGGGGRTFVLADSLGNGLVIHEGSVTQPAVAHTWLHGVEEAWGDVVLEAADSPGMPGWHFEIPGTDLSGEIRPVPAAAPPDTPAVLVEALLSTRDEAFRFSGFAATLSFP